MEVGNLALVMAPNLLQCPTQPCRLTVHTEKQLDQQTAVIKALISHAQHIGNTGAGARLVGQSSILTDGWKSLGPLVVCVCQEFYPLLSSTLWRRWKCPSPPLQERALCSATDSVCTGVCGGRGGEVSEVFIFSFWW